MTRQTHSVAAISAAFAIALGGIGPLASGQAQPVTTGVSFSPFHPLLSAQCGSA